MLYYLLYPLHDVISFFNLFRYITFRAAMAALTAFLASLILGPYIIRLLKARKIGRDWLITKSELFDYLHKQQTDSQSRLRQLSKYLNLLI